jgi:glutathione S-transferase
MAPHVVLEEIGVPYELELISSRGERAGLMTSTPEWRAINPKGRIPALLGVSGSMGGAPMLLTEVPAILVFLALQHPEARLLPRDPALLSRCLEWMNWLSGNVHAMSYGQIWRAQRFSSEDSALDGIRAHGRTNLLEQYAYVESVFADGRNWAIPEGYTVVDPYFLVFFQWGQRIGIAMRDSYPYWSAVTDRVLARPAVQRTLLNEGVTIA